MTLDEAKAFYFKYNGQAFYMDREEPDKSREFRNMHINSETKKRWNEELIEDEFRKMRNMPDKAHMFHESIIIILRRNLVDAAYWGRLLLHETENMSHLDKVNKILIIENMAGRSWDLSDGGVRFFCTCTKLGEEMDRICRKFMDFSCENDPQQEKVLWDMQERLDRVKRSYQQAYAKWNQG